MKYQKFIPEGWNISKKTINTSVLDKAIKTQEILEAKVIKCDENYNLHLQFDDKKTGIINREEIELINNKNNPTFKENVSTSKINKYVQFKVKGIDESNNYILSRKDVEKEAISWIKDEVTEGTILKGIVKSIQPYGAFVEIGGGVVGLVHIEDMSIARIKSPKERVRIGQKINIMVKSIDKAQEKIILTYKELLGSWEDNIQGIEQGTTLIGKAREVEKSKNGIFIELKPNLVGLAEYKDGIEYGQNVNVYVKKIIPEKKKIKLIIV
ncbi:MAG: S1 RNA-binding domain-containing protein [Clostridia bacterium]|nr:S1 RNA-binding domain-containing protein [Clostridia bacterium]